MIISILLKRNEWYYIVKKLRFLRVLISEKGTIESRHIVVQYNPILHRAQKFGGKTSVRLGTLQWRHNDPDGVSNHQPHDCILNRLFRRRSKKSSKLRVTGLCMGNSSVAGEFPAQRSVTRKLSPFHNVIMTHQLYLACVYRELTGENRPRYIRGAFFFYQIRGA